MRALDVLPDILIDAAKKGVKVNSDLCEKINGELQIQEKIIFEIEQQSPSAASELRQKVEEIRKDPQFYAAVSKSDNFSFEEKSVSQPFMKLVAEAKIVATQRKGTELSTEVQVFPPKPPALKSETGMQKKDTNPRNWVAVMPDNTEGERGGFFRKPNK